MITSLVRYVRKHVNPEEYYKSVFPEVSWLSGNSEVKVLSPFVDEKVPSLSINKETGQWYSFCDSDRRGGNSIISFQAAYDECDNKEAALTIYHKFVHPVVSETVIRKCARKLHKTPDVLKYIRKRLISKKTAERYKLGWNGSRIVFPICNELGVCVNIKLYDPVSKTKFKMINYRHPKDTRSYGSPTVLYPLEVLLHTDREEPLFVCEGEWDTLSLISLGLKAVTSTSGANTWPSSYNELFSGRNIILAYDNDAPGKQGARRVYKQLLNIAKTIKQIEVPKKYGKDVNDYIISQPGMRDKEAWLSWASKTEPLVTNPDELVLVPESEIVDVSLDQASDSEWCGRRIRVMGLVSGKDYNPYLLTQKFRISCEESCEGCPIAESSEGYKDFELERTDPVVLRMIDTTHEVVRRVMLYKSGIKKTKVCKAKIDRLEAFNVLRIVLIPTLDSQAKEYVSKPAYYIGTKLLSNRSYQFEGTLLPSSKDQHATFLFDTARPIQSDVETFELSDKQCKRLIHFRPKRLSHLAKLQSIADWQSFAITKIINRPDLHIAVDLAFHSVAAFWFNKEFVPRGMLDILILGDTKCGKGYVAERLSKYYGLGDIASGDNCSFAGLVGGLQQLTNNWRVSWGLIPLNHKRLVIIDEASSMSEKDIARLSRIRSEGVAELVKIVRESTQANTRIIWLSNPRSGRKMFTYNTGIEAVRELVGAMEDISRFDLVLTVATDEVASEDINTLAEKDYKDTGKYSAELCQALILWAWSRTPEQIVFTDKATDIIIKRSREFGHFYSSAIPLVQPENIRFKLAKISAAVAARTFSTDEKYEKLIVNADHANCAASLLTSFYNKPSMGYNLYSQTTAAASSIDEPHKINEAIKNYGTADKLITITGLLEMQQITTDSLADYVEDPVNAKNMIGELVRCRAIYAIEGTHFYNKSPDFIKLLRKKRSELLKEMKNEKMSHRKSH